MSKPTALTPHGHHGHHGHHEGEACQCGGRCHNCPHRGRQGSLAEGEPGSAAAAPVADGADSLAPRA